MFTGIVSSIGQVSAVHRREVSGLQLEVTTPPGFLTDVAAGDSIAVNGCCLTVTTLDAAGDRYTADVSAETLACTTGLDEPGAVNLEKAVRADQRLGGHLVSGHVDGVGTVLRMEPVGESWQLLVAVPKALARYVAHKGSVAVNGTSLTVNRVTDDSAYCTFEANLIPHTVAHTTLGELQPGSRVNIEVDLIARYVERMLPRTTP